MSRQYKVVIAQSGKKDVKYKKQYIIQNFKYVNMLKIFPKK